jgi:hypothetical protein
LPGPGATPGFFLPNSRRLQRIAGPVAELSIARCKILFHSLRRWRTRGRVKLEADAVGTSLDRLRWNSRRNFFAPLTTYRE